MKKAFLILTTISLIIITSCSVSPHTKRTLSTSTIKSEVETFLSMIEARLGRIATTTETQLYLDDFIDLKEGLWQVDYDRSLEAYHISANGVNKDLQSSYYQPFWDETRWVMLPSGIIVALGNAQKLEADLQSLVGE
jgi:hypothetical protein